MPRFKYTALTPQGKKVKNTIVEPSKSACIKKIKRSGLIPITVKPTFSINITNNKQDITKRKNLKSAEQLRQEEAIRKKVSKKKNQGLTLSQMLNTSFTVISKKITSRDVRIFTQDFYLLKKANFNNIQALSTVIQNTENESLQRILEDILAGVEAGEFMYTTMEYYASVFPYIYINMIKVGELSGTLEESLEQAVEYLEDKDSLTRKIKKILLPNLFMFVGLTLLTILAVIFGVPMLENLFESMGATQKLPEITMWFSNVCNKLIEKWYIVLAVLFGIAGVFYGLISTPIGRYRFDLFKYKMPIFGKLIYSLDFSRLMQSVYLNMKNGMRIQEALEVSKNVIKNTVLLATIETSINNIYAGDSWITPFENSDLATPMMTEMLKIGMQTDLTEMIKKLVDYIAVDIENTLEKIVKVLPEVSYMFVGVVLIFFTLVVLVPIIQVYMGGWLFDAYGV